MLFFHGKVTRIQSLCEDVMFTATSGRKKPKKLLMLGISMKSLTGSRKVRNFESIWALYQLSCS